MCILGLSEESDLLHQIALTESEVKGILKSVSKSTVNDETSPDSTATPSRFQDSTPQQAPLTPPDVVRP